MVLPYLDIVEIYAHNCDCDSYGGSNIPVATDQEVPTEPTLALLTDYKSSEFQLQPLVSNRATITPEHISPIPSQHPLTHFKIMIQMLSKVYDTPGCTGLYCQIEEGWKMNVQQAHNRQINGKKTYKTLTSLTGYTIIVPRE